MKILKTLLFISIYLTIVSAKDWDVKYGSEIKSIRDNCLAKYTIPDENFKNMKQFKFDNVPEVQQYLFCTAKGLEIIDEDNKLLKSNVVEQFRMNIKNRTTVEEIVDKCEIETKETSEIVMIYKFFLCLLSDTNEIGKKIRQAATKSDHLELNQPELNQEEPVNIDDNNQNNDTEDSLSPPDPNKSQLDDNDHTS